VDRVELRGIAEDSARVAALLADQVDIVLELPLRGLQRLEGNPAVVVQSAKTSFWHGIAAFTDVPPFDDVRVRQALKLVVNRDQYLKAVAAGHGATANDTPVPPWQKYGLPDLPKPPDIAAARQLLAEAGHPDGIDLELYTSAADSGLIEIATLFKAQAAPAGIRVTINQAPAADYWSNIWLKKPFVVTSWNARAADEALALPFLSTGEWNESHWHNKEFDSLIFQARRTLDEGKRTELYQAAQRLLQRDGGTIILTYSDTVGASRANVRGWKIHPQKITHDFSDVSIGS
jgi:peptide/nickel transport system substrate-binding protein